MQVTIKEIHGCSVSKLVYERFANLIYEVFINYPIDDKTLNENSQLVDYLYPCISVRSPRHLFLVRHAKYRYAPEAENKVLTDSGIQVLFYNFKILLFLFIYFVKALNKLIWRANIWKKYQHTLTSSKWPRLQW